MNKTQKREPVSVVRVCKRSLEIVWQHKKTLGGILLLYGLLRVLFLQGFASGDFRSLHDILHEPSTTHLNNATVGFVLLAYLVGTSTTGNTADTSAYLFFVTVITSLAFIWALRHISTKHLSIRDSFYKGMYPLVPFLLLLLLVGLQLLPLLVGGWLYGTVVSNTIAATWVEHILWLGVFGALAAVSFYFISVTTVALYIVTLPDMTPVTALRAARTLVRTRRLFVVRSIAVLLVLVTIIMCAVMLPVILLAAIVAPFVFYVISTLLFGLTLTYLYSVYKELLADE
jgi:hypothetical protein